MAEEDNVTTIQKVSASLILLICLCFAIGGCIFGVRSNRLAKEYGVFNGAFIDPKFTKDTVTKEEYDDISKRDKTLQSGKWLLVIGGIITSILFVCYIIYLIFTPIPRATQR